MLAEILRGLLLGSAVLLTLACSISVLLARDPLDGLHYLSPPATVAGPLIVLATLFGPHGAAAALRAALTVLVLVVVNAVVAHATARAIRVRKAVPSGSVGSNDARGVIRT
jgi:multisubunit Na+/H+ antiporter MnhG subunit